MLFGGGLLVYTVVTMFPDEEGKLQDRIESLWVVIDDKQKSEVGRATALFNRIASYVTRIYNCILGRRLFSLQMVGISSAPSIGGFFIFAAILLLILLYLSLSQHSPVTPKFNAALFIVGIVCLILGSFFIVFAALPLLIRNWFGRAISLLPLLIFVYGMGLISLRHQSTSTQLTVIAGLFIGIASDIAVLAAVRVSVRLISTSAQLKEIMFARSFNCSLSS